MSEMMPETRDALSPQLRAISDTLDKWLMRIHAIRSSWASPDYFLRWLEGRGWTVVEIADRKRLEEAYRLLWFEHYHDVYPETRVDHGDCAACRFLIAALPPEESEEGGTECA